MVDQEFLNKYCNGSKTYEKTEQSELFNNFDNMLLQSSMRDPDLEKAGLGQPTFTIQELDCFHADFERCQITGPVGNLILHRLRGWRAEAMDASRLDASPPGERSLKRRRKARDEPATQQEETLRSSWASRVFGSLQK
ncbi:unnamed protein product [Polarella glacialis]|uniref:Uncharacterized protein n=1 Tax=Polarella glacialis TaxID=89957 RepID=A0A813GC54_POLGL|nr:unnamed protein product [Polarella glacialis]